MCVCREDGVLVRGERAGRSCDRHTDTTAGPRHGARARQTPQGRWIHWVGWTHEALKGLPATFIID